MERTHAVLGIPFDVLPTAALDDQLCQWRAGYGIEGETGKAPAGQSLNRCTWFAVVARQTEVIRAK